MFLCEPCEDERKASGSSEHYETFGERAREGLDRWSVEVSGQRQQGDRGRAQRDPSDDALEGPFVALEQKRGDQGQEHGSEMQRRFRSQEGCKNPDCSNTGSPENGAA